MDSLMPLLLLFVCACAAAEPLSQAVKRRSDILGVYASEFARAYEPVAYVAIPLHSPMPVLRILSSVPLDNRVKTPDHQRKRPTPKPNVYASSMTHSWYAKPREPQNTAQSWYTKAQSSNPSPSWYKPASTDNSPWPYKQPSSEASALWYKPQSSDASPVWYDSQNSEEETSPPVILFAKPNENGGFTYRRRPAKKNLKKPKKEPIIIRVHKYRIVRDR